MSDFNNENFDLDTPESGSALIQLNTDMNVDMKFEEGSKIVMTIALRNMVLFPDVVLPVQLGRRKSLIAAKRAIKTLQPVAIFTQKNAMEEAPGYDDLNKTGVLAKVLKIFDTPDGRTTAILQGVRRVSLSKLDDESDCLMAEVNALPIDEEAQSDEHKFKVLLDAIKDRASDIFSLMPNVPQEAMFAIKNIDSTPSVVNFLSANFPFTVTHKQELLEVDSYLDRGMRLLGILNSEYQMVQLKADLQRKTQINMDKQQKEFYLQQQMKAIKEELDDSSDNEDMRKLREKAAQKKWSKEVREIFERELNKLDKTPEQSLDYSMQMTYLETFLDLPWGEYSRDLLSLKNAQKILDSHHYGMEEVKDRIIEHLAVVKLKGDMKSPILCLYGPPGVGKTSLGKSVAEAMGRKYVRVALGGIHDESEIRGHRRTYVGAMPGRILKAIKEAGTSNPVFILDEIDKVSHENGFHGSPESALLEVLDPEQNKNFHDNYLDVDYDLSKVMFIATANDISHIPSALKDRMEFINITGYSTEEKLEIATKHIIPKVRKENGLGMQPITFTTEGLKKIIEGYTRESGVRSLEKNINKVMRKIAKRIAFRQEYKYEIDEEGVKEYLGNKEILHEIYEGNENIGVVAGLAWTEVGGEMLFVETSVAKSKSPKFTLTGQLGDVMKESATIAYEYVKSNCDMLGLDYTVFDEKSLHVHFPDGSTPKDGPSAGITIATAIASAFTGRHVKANLAMTGEITLRGKVTAVGGIKEKMLAAKRAGVKEVILCKDNERDIKEIKPEYLSGMTFHYVSEVKDVFGLALV